MVDVKKLKWRYFAELKLIGAKESDALNHFFYQNNRIGKAGFDQPVIVQQVPNDFQFAFC